MTINFWALIKSRKYGHQERHLFVAPLVYCYSFGGSDKYSHICIVVTNVMTNTILPKEKRKKYKMMVSKQGDNVRSDLGLSSVVDWLIRPPNMPCFMVTSLNCLGSLALASTGGRLLQAI